MFLFVKTIEKVIRLCTEGKKRRVKIGERKEILVKICQRQVKKGKIPSYSIFFMSESLKSVTCVRHFD